MKGIRMRKQRYCDFGRSLSPSPVVGVTGILCTTRFSSLPPLCHVTLVTSCALNDWIRFPLPHPDIPPPNCNSTMLQLHTVIGISPHCDRTLWPLRPRQCCKGESVRGIGDERAKRRQSHTRIIFPLCQGTHCRRYSRRLSPISVHHSPLHWHVWLALSIIGVAHWRPNCCSLRKM